ncbi:LLM class flavin-dependent oxidoreductase [Nakamurella antarctica]|uniref:LLM class flavin-dependent oxidoreductase n=1 Tax=Nakamurella antarctica TaxID=1902245 RepID=A0A3G8ZHN4_9ACTN|nr:LLM class flavin-dependent oxidoreductase [Nakamurella antarctica]AZI56859.1 LLM class flavin-dependent oxidoreductase [Nakamurella antarctica]
MEFGVYTFGDIHPDPLTGAKTDPGQRLKEIIDRITFADELGLHYFGIGEHHRPEYSISAPATVLAAAATVTKKIKLGSAVTVLSTEDPVRVYQQFATIDLLSNGRAELLAGRGSFIESFPLFGYELADYDELYEEKLALLLKIDERPEITWSGHHRPALVNQVVLPRPVGGHLSISIATGGNPESSARAGLIGLPINYAIIGGQPERFAPLVNLYHEAYAQGPGVLGADKVTVSAFGFVAEESAAATDTYFPYWMDSMGRIARERRFSPPSEASYVDQTGHRGALFVGSPEEIAERIVYQHGHLKMDRLALQMDLSGVPHHLVMKSIELLATEVMPMVNRELGH